MEALQGYPLPVFYAALIIGVVLVCYRPQWAFLFIVFCLSVRNYHLAVYTRTPFLGEFVNLNDLFLWIGVAALLMNGIRKSRIWFPPIVLAIIGILLAGTFQSLFLYGFNYFVMRDIWASWIFPIMFLIGVNFVRNNEDSRLFIWALFLGSLGAAIQHIISVQLSVANPEHLARLYPILLI